MPYMKHTLLFISFLLSFLAPAQEQYPVYFDFDKDVANDTSQVKFNYWLQTHKDVEVVKIYGYADSVGSTDYNIKLSWRRAAFVENQLKQNSALVSSSPAEVNGFGENTVFSKNRSTDRLVMIHYFEKPEGLKDSTVATLTCELTLTIPTTSGLTASVNNAKIGERLRIPNMNFYNGMEEMLPEAKPVLDELLQIMINNPQLKITIEGHICCDRLEDDKLSIRRAKAIYNHLIKNGISKKRLRYQGYAGTNPIHFIPEKNEQERAENRRVEIHINAK